MDIRGREEEREGGRKGGRKGGRQGGREAGREGGEGERWEGGEGEETKRSARIQCFKQMEIHSILGSLLCVILSYHT